MSEHWSESYDKLLDGMVGIVSTKQRWSPVRDHERLDIIYEILSTYDHGSDHTALLAVAINRLARDHE